MHILLIALLIAAFFGPVAVLRFVSGLGCFVLLAIGGLALVCLWLDNQPGSKESHPYPVTSQHDYESTLDGLWVRLPSGRVLKKGSP
jgi:hypothetical protein